MSVGEERVHLSGELSAARKTTNSTRIHPESGFSSRRYILLLYLHTGIHTSKQALQNSRKLLQFEIENLRIFPLTFFADLNRIVSLRMNFIEPDCCFNIRPCKRMYDQICLDSRRGVAFLFLLSPIKTRHIYTHRYMFSVCRLYWRDGVARSVLVRRGRQLPQARPDAAHDHLRHLHPPQRH